MGFLTNVTFPGDIGVVDLIQNYTGFEVMFGVKEKLLGKEVEVLLFSFVALLAYLLPIIGLVIAILFNKSKVLSVVPILCFIASAILFFLMPEFVVSDALSGGVLAVGAIIAGVLNILSAICVTAKVLLA